MDGRHGRRVLGPLNFAVNDDHMTFLKKIYFKEGTKSLIRSGTSQYWDFCWGRTEHIYIPSTMRFIGIDLSKNFDEVDWYEYDDNQKGKPLFSRNYDGYGGSYDLTLHIDIDKDNLPTGFKENFYSNDIDVYCKDEQVQEASLNN